MAANSAMFSIRMCVSCCRDAEIALISLLKGAGGGFGAALADLSVCGEGIWSAPLFEFWSTHASFYFFLGNFLVPHIQEARQCKPPGDSHGGAGAIFLKPLVAPN